MIKKCQQCKKFFEPNEQENLYCSLVCRIANSKCQKRYRLKHKQKIKELDKNYQSKHKEDKREYDNNYRLEHKEKIAKYMKEYRIKRLENDISFKILGNLRHRTWCALKQNTKSLHTKELIGCNIEFLKRHLESQFTVGMSWDNYGKWHIDHIRPCASFDLSTSENQKLCFHYSNLQPLWAHDNLVKKDKI